MTHSALNHGTLGRCACGDVGRRRSSFSREPICRQCMPMRAGMMRVLDGYRSEGTMTPSQRRARKAFLRDSR